MEALKPLHESIKTESDPGVLEALQASLRGARR
jgi:hypothetical protein